MYVWSGAIHVPVRPLSSEEEKLATVTAAVEESNTEEHTTSTHSSTSRTNASSNKPGRAAPHVEAFSGKGHTLSSDTHPSFNSSRPSELLRWTELPGQQRAGLERLGHIGNLGQVESTGQLNRQTDLLGQKGAQGQADLSGQAERFVEAEPPGHSELSGQAGILGNEDVVRQVDFSGHDDRDDPLIHSANGGSEATEGLARASVFSQATGESHVLSERATCHVYI